MLPELIRQERRETRRLARRRNRKLGIVHNSRGKRRVDPRRPQRNRLSIGQREIESAVIFGDRFQQRRIEMFGPGFINIRLALHVRSMRQFELAHELGVSESYLCLIIAARRPASPKLRRKVAQVLSCSESWLFSKSPIVPTGAPATHHAQVGGAA